MTHVYAPTYRAVKTAQVLENSVSDGMADDVFVETQVRLACMADSAYERLRDAARGMANSAGLGRKEAMAVCVVDLALQLHNTHVDTGAKTACTPDHLAELLQKLASAVFVDELLLQQLEMLEGDTKLAAEQVQMCGREWIMDLVGQVLP